MSKISIFISTSVFGKESDLPLKILQQEGIEYQLNPFGRKLTVEETTEFLKDKHGVISGTEAYPAQVIRALNKLKVISRCGAGTDGIDTEELKKRGIALLRTENVHVQAVSELTIGALVALARKIPQHQADMRNMHWHRQAGTDIGSSVLGIVGFGKVGQRVAELLAAWGCKIIVYDPYYSGKPPGHVRLVRHPDELWSTADFITLHLPLNSETHQFINSRVFSQLKKDVKIVNTARGELISEEDLALFLEQNQMAAAFFDVFWEEPYRGKLLELPNFIATPHIGTFTTETRIRMELEAVKNLINYFKGSI